MGVTPVLGSVSTEQQHRALELLNTGDHWRKNVEVKKDEKPPEDFEPALETEDGGYLGWVPIEDETLPDPTVTAPGVYVRN